MQGFHGNVVSVYIKKSDAPKGRASLLKGSEYWTRIVLDDTHFFGPLDPKGHTGTIHHVATGDFDGKGVDAFAIACMGARRCIFHLRCLLDTNDSQLIICSDRKAYVCFVSLHLPRAYVQRTLLQRKMKAFISTDRSTSRPAGSAE